MTVTFCGHRTLEHPVQVKSWLREVVCDLIGQGANIFLLGGYGAFDLMAAQIVHELKAEFPDIESTLVLAYLSTDVDLRLYDNSLYPPLELSLIHISFIRQKGHRKVTFFDKLKARLCSRAFSFILGGALR